MEATGKVNPFSTPESRMRKRDNAALVGKVQKVVTSQPALISYVAAALFVAGFVEKVSF